MPSGFLSLGVREDLVQRLDRLGIAEPYPIQSATLPDTLAGRDLCAESPTGSGKTLAFAIPMISRVGRAEPHRPRGLVLSPTRELAAQITEAIRPLAEAAHRRVTSVYGGAGYGPQLRALERGVDVVVGCPGRLIDLLDRGAIDLSRVEVVVVDEADLMADMGFLPAVRRLLEGCRAAHQTMLFSATVSGDVERLVTDYQKDPVRHLLQLPAHDLGSRSHEFRRIAQQDRSEAAADLVKSVVSSIIFCRTKHGVDRLVRQLGKAGIDAVAIHGDRSQAQRDRALAEFRNGRARVLVGTDVASRGLHIEGVDCVVHFDLPGDDDTYVHRSGRTGRAGASGRVVTFVTPEHEKTARRLEQRFGEAGVMAPSVAPRSVAPRSAGHAERDDARRMSPSGAVDRESAGQRGKNARHQKPRRPQPNGTRTAVPAGRQQRRRRPRPGAVGAVAPRRASQASSSRAS